MGKHARYYDTRFQAGIAALALFLIGVWCRLHRAKPSRHEPAAGMTPVTELTRVKRSWCSWPDGADLAYAEELRAMQDTVVLREEVRA